MTTLHVNKGKAHSRKKSLCFFLRSFFLRKITIMASVSKLFPGQTDRMGTKIFWLFFFFGNQGSDDEKVRQKINMMASVSLHSPGPKNRIGKKYFWWPKFWPKNCPGVSRLFSRPTQARKHETENIWISKTNRLWKELGLVVDIWR